MEDPRTLAWSGRSWLVKASSTPVGPGPNLFSDSTDNVWVDLVGRLHLKITARRGRWYVAEVGSGRVLATGPTASSSLLGWNGSIPAWSRACSRGVTRPQATIARSTSSSAVGATRHSAMLGTRCSPTTPAATDTRSGRPLRPRPAMSSDGRRTACHSAVPVRPARPSPAGTIAVVCERASNGMVQ